MIASLLNKTSRVALTLSVAGMLVASPSLAQEETETKKQEEAVSKEAVKTVPKDRYFLGGRPVLQRQKGPALGKPKSILPQPFVPKGSVKVPAAPTAENTIQDTNLLTDQSEGLVQEVSDQEAFETAVNTQTANITDDFSEASLSLLDPSGIAVLPADEGFPVEFWAGYDRDAYKALLKDFENSAGSPALSSIANKLVLSAIAFESTEDEQAILDLINARLDLLQKLGNAQGYIALLDVLPAGRDWAALSRHFANAYLIKGNIADACAVAAGQRETDNDAYWLRMTAFCKAVEANRIAVDFELGILEEVSEVHPTFYQLIDKILVEAEQQASGLVSTKVELSSPLQVDLLEAGMARLAGVVVPELALENVNPLAVAAILSNANVAGNAKADLMGLAVREGWATGDVYAQFARAYAATNEEIEAATQLAADDTRFSIDAVLGYVAGDVSKQEARPEALQLAWGRAVKQKYTSVAGGGLLSLSSDTVPNAENIASVGVLVRAALVSGNVDAAKAWYRVLRAQSADTNVDADAVLLELAPLMRLLTGEAEIGGELLDLWWQGQAANESKYERANMLFTVMEALEVTVPETAWAFVEDGPVAFGGQTPSPALWRKFLITAADGNAPAALALAYALLSEGGTASVPLSLAGSLVGTLNSMGLKQEARLIATEMLIAQGL